MSDKKQEVLSHWEHSGIWRCVCVVHCFSFRCCVFVLCLVNTDVCISWVHSQVLCIEVFGVHFVLLFVLTFFVLCCDVCCIFLHKCYALYFFSSSCLLKDSCLIYFVCVCSVVRYPLRFPHENDVLYVFSPTWL